MTFGLHIMKAYMDYMFKSSHSILDNVIKELLLFSPLGSNNLSSCGLNVMIGYFYIHRHELFYYDVYLSYINFVNSINILYQNVWIYKLRIIIALILYYYKGVYILLPYTHIPKVSGSEIS